MAVDLGQQVGPLPLGAWIAVVAGGLGLAYYSYSHSGSGGSADTTDPNAGLNLNTVGNGAVGGWDQTQPSSDTTTPVITTNEAWARQAINWLIAQGYDASESDSAIRKYIAGNDPAPSIKEYALQTLALAHFGSPPNPLPPALTPPPVIPPGNVYTPGDPEPAHPVPNPVPVPTPAPPPAPANVRWYTVQPWPRKGSSLWTIAEIFYGNGAQWPRIYNANKKGVRRPDGSLGMINDPNTVYTGWKLYIP